MEIICTIIPDARGVERFPLVFDAGMTMLRLNFSHIDGDGAKRLVKAVHMFNKMRGREVRVLQDLRGPKMVMGRVPGDEVEVPVGQPVRFCTPGLEGTFGRYRGLVVPVHMEGEFKALASARRIAAKDASILFEIMDNRADREGWIETEVARTGVLRTEKGLNAPGMKRGPALTAKDRKDLALGLRLKVDVVCLSFVSGADEVREARKIVKKKGGHEPAIWAKVETEEAIGNASQIVKAADGIVIGRGDLAAETSRYKVAEHQRKLTRLAKKGEKTCILATGILESLRRSTNPTFAELRDIDTSLREGVDGFLLTSETSIGRHPHLAVEVLLEAARARGQMK
jgi:pyruvate kinase